MKKKSGFNYFFWISIFVLVFIVISFSIHYFSFTGNAVIPIALPSDCSESNIKALWDSVFKESSTNIIYITNDSVSNGVCDMILATKNNSQVGYVLYYSIDQSVGYILAKKTLFNLTSKGYTNITNEIQNSNIWKSPLLMVLALSFPQDGGENRTTKIVTTQLANSTFLDTFETPFNNYSDFDWSIGILPGVTPITQAGMFNKSDSYIVGSSLLNRTITGTVYSDYSDQVFIYSIFNLSSGNPSCTPNWTAQDTVCLANETKTITYNDTNSCGASTGKPADIINTCDYDSNGIIGNTSSLGSTYNLSIIIAGSVLNTSLNYSANNTQLVEIKKDSNTIISFSHNFATSPLNLKNITVILNSDTSNHGFIIINGINDTKSVVFNKKNSSSNQVCVKDAYVSAISNISSDCEEANEYLVDCPGSAHGFNCSISNNTFSVTGLAHSAILETVSTTCSANWTCTNWSACTALLKNRTCTDQNNCNTTSGRPTLSESCTPTGVLTSCTPNWTCAEWDPVDCSSGENQTRTCTDANNCNVQTNKPEEVQICEKKSYLSWILIGSGIVVIIAMIIIVVMLFFNKKPSSAQPPVQNQQPFQPPYQPMQTLQERQFPSQPQPLFRPQQMPPQPRPIQQYPVPNNSISNNQTQNQFSSG